MMEEGPFAKLTLRLYYWFAYLADGAVNEAGNHHVAPGCVGTAAEQRCTLEEFLVYIWKETKGDATRPALPIGPLGRVGQPITPGNIKAAFDRITDWVDPAVPKTKPKPPTSLTMGVDYQLLVGVSYHDSFMGLANVLESLEILLRSTPVTKIHATRARILELGKLSLQAVFDRRLDDMERKRAEFIQMRLFDRPIDENGKPGPYPKSQSIPRLKSRNIGGITPDSTAKAAGSKAGGIAIEGTISLIIRETKSMEGGGKTVTEAEAKGLLTRVMEKWPTESKSGKDHYDVLMLVKAALTHLGCPTPEVPLKP
jgi:hypothetical protein